MTEPRPVALALLVLFALPAATCAGPAEEEGAPVSAAPAPVAGAEEPPPTPEKTMDPDAPAADPAALDDLVSGVNGFAFDLYGAVAEGGDDNLFFSPYSVSSALAMTWAGARGETAHEMADALGFGRDPDRIHAAFGELTGRLEQAAGGGQEGEEVRRLRLSIANALWGQDGFAFAEAYRRLLTERYGAHLERLDFRGSPEQARATINRWVEQETEGKIEDLVPPGAIETDTRLVLTNAVYFKGAWTEQFSEGSTRDAPFHLLDGETVQAPMMSRTGGYPYAERQGYRAVELPYAGGDTAMLVVVPDEGAFGRVEGTFSAGELDTLADALETRQVRLGLPRFEVTTAAPLGPALRDLGIERVFTDRADLSGIPAEPVDLYLDRVLHKAWVAVDEEGTEAAAATAASIALTSAPMNPVVLNVDRPFLFLIRHRPTGLVLFAGRVLDPTA